MAAANLLVGEVVPVAVLTIPAALTWAAMGEEVQRAHGAYLERVEEVASARDLEEVAEHFFGRGTVVEARASAVDRSTPPRSASLVVAEAVADPGLKGPVCPRALHVRTYRRLVGAEARRILAAAVKGRGAELALV